MSSHIQDLIACVLVGICVAYLVWSAFARARRLFSPGAKGCGGCGTCGNAGSTISEVRSGPEGVATAKPAEFVRISPRKQ